MRHFLKTRIPGLFALFLGFFTFPASATTYYVDINSPNPTPPYTSWATASTDIQSALNQTTNGDLVLVNPGVYQSGGYTAPDGTLSAVVVSNSITLQGVGGASTTFINGSNAMRGIYLQSTSVLTGFTITNGALGYGNDGGGGIYCQSTACQISNCIIIGNVAENEGGGAYQGTLLNCSIINNNAGIGGGAYQGTLVNCTILDNYASSYGGGAASALIYQSLIVSNFVGYSPGYSEGCGGGVYNCTNFSSALADNYAENEGGGAYGSILVNCTITRNTAYSYGGGTESCTQTNCIIYYNQIFNNDPYATNVDGTCSYCCTTPNTGTKCVIGDPQLADISHTSLNSPCRGAGNPAVTGGVDIDGNPWANPPSIGCSEPYPGNYMGNLTVGISVSSTNQATAYPINFQANISGPVYSNIWNLGDGTLMTNQSYVSHTWSTTGVYTVTLTAYNDSYPTGVTATLPLTIAVPGVYYVNLNNPTPYYPYIPQGIGPYVEMNGRTGPVPPYSSWGTAAADIQDAVNVATPGSIVLVTNGPTDASPQVGDYTNAVTAFYINGGAVAPNGQFYRVMVTNPITVESVNGPAVTYIWGTLSGGSAAGCVYLTNGATLSGFTLTNGTSSAAGGVYCASTNAIITNCVITHCSSGIYSGTSYNCFLTASRFSAAIGSTMFNCVISNNSAVDGGGIYGGILNNCLIVSNTATYGGGVYCASGYPALLNNCLISNNTAEYGGGVYANSVTNCILSNCTVTRNSVSQYGGGAFNAQLNNCLISSNSAGGGGAGVCGGILNNCIIISNSASIDGGGIYAAVTGFPPYLSCPAVLNNCLISNNVAGNSGGGVCDLYNSLPQVTNCILNNCTLTHNFASQTGGGALSVQLNNCIISSNQAYISGGGTSSSTLTNCVLMNNVAGRNGNPDLGGGALGGKLVDCTILGNASIYGYGGGAAYALIYSSLVISNVASNFGGGVYYCTNFDSALSGNLTQTSGGGACGGTLFNCTITGNTAVEFGGGATGCQLTNCIIYYNGVDINGADPNNYDNTLNYCCTPDTGNVGCITNAPLFVNAAAGNFHLQPNSPCINSGNNAYVTSATDLDGNPRIVGGTVDIGAYEYQSPTSVISYAWLQQYGLPTDGSVDFANLNGTAFNVYQDWIAGLNPTNSASVLAMLTPAATINTNGITVTWQSVSGISYNLQRSTNLFVQPVFTTIQSNIVGQANTTSYTDTSATNNVPYFYRVGALAP